MQIRLQDGLVIPCSSGTSAAYNIEPFPGLEAILEELLKEVGYDFILYLCRKFV